MAFQSAGMPIGDPLTDDDGFITQPWIDWSGPVLLNADAAPARVTLAALTNQSASISATSLGAALAGGLYRVSWYLRITQAATTSSSATVTIGFQESTVVLSTSGAAVTGNTTTTIQSGSVLVRADSGTLTYAVAYASVGATPMKFRIDVVVEEIAT